MWKKVSSASMVCMNNVGYKEVNVKALIVVYVKSSKDLKFKTF